MSSDKIYFDHKNEAFKFELTIRKFNVIEVSSNMKGRQDKINVLISLGIGKSDSD